MDTAEKVRENRLRRMAERQGKLLRKSRRRDPRAIDFGTWSLVDPQHNVLLAQSDDLDQVERWLTED